jgi:hypothetical protein
MKEDGKMIVSAWSNGGGTFGIKVGAINRKKFFDRAWERIEVEIDGKLHKFQLTPGFWKGCPEFRDSGEKIIQGWLQRNYEISWAKYKPPQFILEKVCGQHFKLMKMSEEIVN